MPKIEKFLKPDERVIKEQARITESNMAPHSGTKVKRFCTEFGTPAKPEDKFCGNYGTRLE